MGAAVRLPDGSYQVITGNQIAAILVDYLLYAHQQAGTLPSNALVVKSIVSSELPTAVAKAMALNDERINRDSNSSQNKSNTTKKLENILSCSVSKKATDT